MKRRLAGHVARIVCRKVVYRIFVFKPQGKKPLRRPRIRRENNIGNCKKKFDLVFNWIDIVQVSDRWWDFLNVVMNLRVP
jgi:hypothetical protein